MRSGSQSVEKSSKDYKERYCPKINLKSVKLLTILGLLRSIENTIVLTQFIDMC